MSEQFPFQHRDGKTKARIISETADEVRISFVKGRALQIEGEVTLSKPDFLNVYGMNRWEQK